MLLYGSSFSPFVRKIIVFAAEAGIEIELKQIGLGDPDPDFAVCSPLRKMPALRDGDFTLADSSAIAHYLEAKFAPGLIPSDPQGRARAVWWDEVGDTFIFAAFQPLFFNRVVLPLFQRWPGDEAAAQAAEAGAVPKVLDWLEGQVPDEGWLLGDRFTLADISVATPFVNYRQTGAVLDDAKHPKLKAYIERALERPSYDRVAKDDETVAKIRASMAGA